MSKSAKAALTVACDQGFFCQTNGVATILAEDVRDPFRVWKLCEEDAKLLLNVRGTAHRPIAVDSI
jgi:hypothetical protein